MPDQTDVRKLEDALRKAGSPRGTRRWLLERAGVGAAGVAAGGALDPAGAALARGDHSSINAFGTVAVTTEALTVTLLTEVLRRANLNSVPAGVGFGTPGGAPGAFYTLPHPIMPPPIKINSNKPA